MASGMCDGDIHHFPWFVRTCQCGVVTVPEPSMQSRCKPPGEVRSDTRADKAKARLGQLAEVERRLAEGAPTVRARPKRGRAAMKV